VGAGSRTLVVGLAPPAGGRCRHDPAVIGRHPLGAGRRNSRRTDVPEPFPIV